MLYTQCRQFIVPQSAHLLALKFIYYLISQYLNLNVLLRSVNHLNIPLSSLLFSISTIISMPKSTRRTTRQSFFTQVPTLHQLSGSIATKQWLQHLTTYREIHSKTSPDIYPTEITAVNDTHMKQQRDRYRSEGWDFDLDSMDTITNFLAAADRLGGGQGIHKIQMLIGLFGFYPLNPADSGHVYAMGIAVDSENNKDRVLLLYCTETPRTYKGGPNTIYNFIKGKDGKHFRLRNAFIQQAVRRYKVTAVFASQKRWDREEHSCVTNTVRFMHEILRVGGHGFEPKAKWVYTLGFRELEWDFGPGSRKLVDLPNSG
jgi:hypothetical protein